MTSCLACFTGGESAANFGETVEGSQKVMRVSLLLALVVGPLVAGCSDNATRLADRVREGASRLGSPRAGDSVTVSYEPVAGTPYTVVFFPKREVAESDLVA